MITNLEDTLLPGGAPVREAIRCIGANQTQIILVIDDGATCSAPSQTVTSGGVFCAVPDWAPPWGKS